MKKKMISLMLAVVMATALTVPACAAESNWKVEVSGKADAFVGTKTFTVREWDFSVENDIMILTKADSRKYTAENLYVLSKGDTAVFTKGGEAFQDFFMAAWSDPDGDGVYDSRLMDLNTEEILPADIASPLLSGYNEETDEEYGGPYANGLYLQIHSWEGKEEMWVSAGFGIVGEGTEVALSADHLLDTLGPNTLLSITAMDGDWSCTILVEGDTAQPQQPANTAYASTQNVLVDGKAVEFQCYALKDANGNDTNYIKLRDVAQILNGTAAQFEVSWDGAVNIVTDQSYTANGSEMSTPFSGNRSYTVPTAETKVNGAAASLDAIILTDDGGNGYTYYKLRDLGTALGFTVDWSAEKGIFIETT